MPYIEFQFEFDEEQEALNHFWGVIWGFKKSTPWNDTVKINCDPK